MTRRGMAALKFAELQFQTFQGGRGGAARLGEVTETFRFAAEVGGGTTRRKAQYKRIIVGRVGARRTIFKVILQGGGE